MNHSFCLIWSGIVGSLVPVAEYIKGKRKGSGRVAGVREEHRVFSSPPLPTTLCAALAMAFCGNVHALPEGGQIARGTGTIGQSANTMTVAQTSQRLAINWQTFNIGSAESLTFNQPSASAIALNRVLGQNASQIMGSLSANGQVFITNPNGVLFGTGAQVNVGGLVATTNSLSDADFLAGLYRFTGDGTASVVNQGRLTAADRGYIALLGSNVRNEGVISAQLGTALLAAGKQVTLTLDNGSLIGYNIDQGTLNALVENQNLIKADGGKVFMSVRAADQIAGGVVNHSGVIEAQTIQNIGGVIQLLGNMQNGKVAISGKLDASAPNGGNGGAIEVSAAEVGISDTGQFNVNTPQFTTNASQGRNGSLLISNSGGFDIGVRRGSAAPQNMKAETLFESVMHSNVTIQSGAGSGTSGDVFVNADVVALNNNLTLKAQRHVNIDGAIVSTTPITSIVLRADSEGSGTGVVNFLQDGRVHADGARTDIYYNPVQYSNFASDSANYASKKTGTGSLKLWMLVNDLNHLQAMETNLAGNYAMGKNIDARQTANALNPAFGPAGFRPIGIRILSNGTDTPFTGQFDGLNHTISDLFINSGNTGPFDVGLFGKTSAETIISNVGLINPIVEGMALTGALAGFNNGAIRNSYSTGSQGRVMGPVNVGGLVGTNAGTMEGVYSDLAVSGAVSIGGLVGLNLGGTINNAYSTGTVTTIAWGNEFETAAGGFVGNNTGNIINAYSTGAVNGKTFVGGFVGYNNASGTIANVYSTGRVTGLESIGGLIGTNLGSAPIFSYWNIETAGTSTSAGGTALNSSAMLQSAPFAFNNFITVWRQYQGHTTPLLKSFLTPITATLRDTSKVYDGQGWSPLTVASLSDPAAANSAELFGTGSTSRNAGTYTVTPELWSSQRGYDIRVSGPSTVQAQITPKELVLIATAADKVYDDTRDSPASPTFEGLAAGDSLTSLSQVYDSPNAGPRILSVNGYQLSDGNANKNYFVSKIAASSNITPRPLTLTAATDNKEYNRTTTSTGVVTAAGLISDDTVNATQAFDSANAGSRMLQVNTDYIISDGNGGGNYAVTRFETSGNIRKRPLILAAADDSKIYDRSTASTGIVTAVNLVAGDGLSATQAFDSADAGSRRLLVNPDYIINDGAGGANYDATTTFGRGTISPLPLTVTSVGLTKYLDGIPFSGGNGVTYNGFLTGDTPAVLGGRLAFGGSAQGAVGLGVFDITPFGLTSGNYAISPVSGKLVITVAPYTEALAIAQLPGSLPPANAFLDGRAISDAFMVDERDTAEDAERRLNLRIVDGGIRLPAGLK